MVRISGVILNAVEARRESLGRSKSMSISVVVDSIRASKEGGIDAGFTYLVSYAPSVGSLKMVGYVSLAGTKEEIGSLNTEWKSKKAFGKETSKKIVNAITYSCSVNGIFAAKTLNLEPPFAPPAIDIK